MNIKYVFQLIVIGLLCTSCNSAIVYDETIKVGESWSYDEPMSYNFEIEDATQSYSLVYRLNYGSDFEYQNVYVKIVTTYPDGEKSEDIVSLNLTDGRGSFLGDCGRSSCTVDILLREKFKMKMQGNHSIVIYQNGREEDLKGIYSGELILSLAK